MKYERRGTIIFPSEFARKPFAYHRFQRNIQTCCMITLLDDHASTSNSNMKTKTSPPLSALVAALWLAAAYFTYGQNLVTNGNFEAGNSGFTTDYALWAGGPNIGGGQYFVTNNPHFISAWISSGDHTTGSGKMLIADGSTTAGAVLWRQTVAVETNKSYVFSTWGLQIEPATISPPILYFAINGTQIGSAFYVLPRDPSGWQGYGVTWNSAATNSAALELRLQSNKGGPGNNIAVDDVSLIKSSDILPTQTSIESAVQIGWTSYPGASYQVQWSSSVDTNNWFNLGLPVVGNGSTNYVSDPLSSAPRRFYRVLRLE